MENQVQLFNHPEFGGVRVAGDSENPRFCLSDVCKILAIGNPSDVKKRLDGGVVSIEGIIDSLGRKQAVTFINEDGLYDVIIDSRKPSAKKFRKWITNQVVPSIRKTGMYINPNAPIDPAFLRKIADDLEARDKQIAELNTQVTELKPKADYCEKILQSPEAILVTVIAKDYGMGGAAFNKLLHSYRIQRPLDGGRIWVLYADYDDKGYTVTLPTPTRNGGMAMQMKWTQKGRRFLYDFLKARGFLPLCEREEPMDSLFGGGMA